MNEKDNGSLDGALDEIRRQIQESLIESKRERLRDEHNMLADFIDPKSSPELQIEFLDYIMEFERQFEEGKVITVRERIGYPSIRPVAEISDEELGPALKALLERMFEHNLIVDFLGNWEDRSAYRYVTEELLDLVISDIRIEDTYCHLDATTPEYEVESWVDEFVQSVFWQDREHLLGFLRTDHLPDATGQPIALDEFMRTLEEAWARLPGKVNCYFRPVITEVGENEAALVATIAWSHREVMKEIEAHFQLKPSRYYGWDIVQTTLPDVLLAVA